MPLGSEKPGSEQEQNDTQSGKQNLMSHPDPEFKQHLKNSVALGRRLEHFSWQEAPEEVLFYTNDAGASQSGSSLAVPPEVKASACHARHTCTCTVHPVSLKNK